MKDNDEVSEYLDNIYDIDYVYKYVKQELYSCIPIIKWNVTCYHYETRTWTETETDSNGNSRTVTKSETYTVTTHTAQMDYIYRTVQDVSAVFDGLEEYKLTRLNLFKTLIYYYLSAQKHISASMDNKLHG